MLLLFLVVAVLLFMYRESESNQVATRRLYLGPIFTGTYHYVFSGEELLQQIKRQPELPQRGGFKEYEPDGSWLQNKRLETFNQERRDVLLEERVQKMYVITC